MGSGRTTRLLNSGYTSSPDLPATWEALPNGRLELDGRWGPRQPCTAASREGAVEVVS
jgi:hypothetical protein